MAISFKYETEANYKKAMKVSGLVRRLFAQNPSPFTYTGTGSFLIGRENVAIIDPGPALPAHVDNLVAAAEPGTITHIFVTHTHVDHSPAAALLKARTGAKAYGFGPHGGDGSSQAEEDQVEEGADLEFIPDVQMEDGEVISNHEWTIEALHTPGHTSNHICFSLLEEKTVFTGDHVMGWATSVISPPDGNMAHYLASLARLQARDDLLYRPTHGPEIENPQVFVTELIDHRLAREALILKAVQAGQNTLEEITAAAYISVPKGLHLAAARSALAHLLFLEEKGSIRMDGQGAKARFVFPV